MAHLKFQARIPGQNPAVKVNVTLYRLPGGWSIIGIGDISRECTPIAANLEK